MGLGFGAYRFASSVIFAIRLSLKFVCASRTPKPDVTMSPAPTFYPVFLGSESDSPVTRASLTSSPSAKRSTPSQGTWSPSFSLILSPRRISSRSEEHTSELQSQFHL